MDKKILDSLQEGIVIFDENYRIRFCNKSVLEKLNYDINELEKEHLAKIVFDSMNVIIQEREVITNHPLEIVLCDEDYNPIKIKCKIFSESWMDESCYWMLITEYMEKRYTVEELELIVENMPFAIWIGDEEGNYKYANYNALIMFNKLACIESSLEQRDVLRKKPKEIHQNIMCTEVLDRDDEMLRKGMIINEERVTKKEALNSRYHIMKIPIFDSNHQYKGYIGINQYSPFEANLDKIKAIESGGNEELDEKTISDVVMNSLKFNEISSSMFQGESIWVLKYKKEEGQLESICRFGKNIKDRMLGKCLHIDELKVKALLQKNSEWTIEALEKETGCSYRECTREPWIRYVTISPIKYNGEVLGAIITEYESKLKYPLMERSILNNLCKHVASILKNMQFSLEMKRELLVRREVEEKLKIYLSIAVDFITVVDKEDRMTSWNDKGKEVMGWSSEEIKKLTYLSLVHPEDYEATCEAVKEMMRSEEVKQFINRFRHKNGTYRWIRWRGKFDEKSQKIYAIARDITEERKVEKERKDYKEALQLETLKTEFLANMSHELKTPLNIIYSMLQLIELTLKELPPEASKIVESEKLVRYRKVSKQNVLRLLRLINNITDISRFGAGYYEAKRVNCDIVRIIEDITMSVVDYVKKKELSIIFDTEVEELVMACDPEKMERIMLNLLSNAVKYTNEGDKIEVILEIRNQQLMIIVKDTGIGIPQEKQQSIFERFVQVDTSFTRKCEGSGIGLALVKCLVELQKGSIEVRSEVGKGSSFMISLPIEKTDGTQVMGINRNDVLVQKCKVEFSDIYDL